MAVYEKWATIKYGTLTVGRNDSGHDVKLYGATSGNYLLWDESVDDLLLVGTAIQLGIAGTTDASSATTGSIHTAGGIGIEKALWVGTTSKLVGAITADATLGIAGKITSTSTTGVSFNPTLVPDETRTNYIWSYGTRATAKDLAMAASTNYNLDPIQINLAITGTAPTSSTVNLSYMKIAHTIAMTALRLKCSDWNISIANNILDAYVYQGEVDITASSAIGSEVVGLGLTINVSAGTVTGLVRGAVIAMIGSSMPATTSTGLNINTVAPTGTMTLTHAIYLDIGGNTTLTNAIYIANTGTVTNFLKIGTAANFLDAGTTAGDQCIGHIRVSVPAGTGYLNVFSDNS